MTPVIETAAALINRLDLAIVERATIVLVIGLTALALASRARASVRHLLMAATFGTVLVLPLVVSNVPALTIQLPVPVGQTVTRLVSTPVSGAVKPANGLGFRDDTSVGLHTLPLLATVFRSVWVAGATLLLVFLVIDLRRLRALRRGGLPWLGKKDFLRSLVVASGARRPVDVLLHEGICAPLTCGLWRPAILLPVDANDWPEADLRRALVRELEHIRRADWATQLIARVVCACYWFHPLAWMAWRRLHLEAERACDDAVLECSKSTQYAEQLVGLARRLSTARALPSLALANRSDLSLRVSALLDATRRRGRVGYATTAGVVSGASVVIFVVACVRTTTSPPPVLGAALSARPAPVNVVAPEVDQPTVREESARATPVPRVIARRSTSQSAPRALGQRTTEDRVGSIDPQTILRENGVTDDFIRGLTDAGYRNLSLGELLALHHHGVTLDFIESLRRFGFSGVSVGLLLGMRDQGVTKSFIEDFRDLGYTDIPLNDFIALRVQGVTAEFAREQRAVDGGLVSVNELIGRWIRGDS